MLRRILDKTKNGHILYKYIYGNKNAEYDLGIKNWVG